MNESCQVLYYNLRSNLNYSRQEIELPSNISLDLHSSCVLFTCGVGSATNAIN